MSSPSALMVEAFCDVGMGSPTLTCWCGRIHHAPASDFLEQGEEDQMREDAKNNPRKVFLHDGDAVSAITVNGMCVVHGCECNWLGRLEAILLSERDRILKFYKLKRDAAVNEAKTLAAALEATPAHETSNALAPEPPEAMWKCTVCDRHNYSTETHCTQCEYSRMVCQEGKRIPRRGRNG